MFAVIFAGAGKIRRRERPRPRAVVGAAAAHNESFDARTLIRPQTEILSAH